jgi:hypothetical protein
MAAALLVSAVVHDGERPALAAAAEQLRECLSEAAQSTWDVRLEFPAVPRARGGDAAATIAIASMLPDVDTPGETLASVEARWRERLAPPTAAPATQRFICTVFRHLPADEARRAAPARLAQMERIRRLNLLAAELSHDTGAAVIDLDRAFAHLGARVLRADYRLQGPIAARVAGQVIASTMLAVGLDPAVTPEVQQRALELVGPPGHPGALSARPLARRA